MELDRFTRDSEYCEAHYDELLERYPKQWIGILNQHVIGVNEDYDRLLDELRARGVPLWQTLTRHLTRKDVDWELVRLP